MKVPDFTVEQIKRLPLRAIVAFAARCARRAEPLAQLPLEHPEHERRRAAVDAALRMAESVARGSTACPDESVAAAIPVVAGAPEPSDRAAAAAAAAVRAAASTWYALSAREAGKDKPGWPKTPEARKLLDGLDEVSVDVAALDAFTAAAEAFRAFGYHNDEFVAAALNDFDRLLLLNLGHFPDQGASIDPSPSGPLGLL
jgi:hypothetical protein